MSEKDNETDFGLPNEPRSLKAFAILFFIFGALILLGSGLCTLVFLAGGSGEGAIAIGAIAFIPAAILVFAMIFHFKKGPNYLSATIMALFALFLWSRALTDLKLFLIGLPFLIFAVWSVTVCVSRANHEEPK